MRIISQDGRTDIPYENFVFGATKDNYIIAIRDTIARPSEVAHGIVAKYSTEAKAQKAMEMLHDSYNNFDWIKTTGFSDEIKAVCKHITKEDFKALTSPYFRFPKDEDVEVENET